MTTPLRFDRREWAGAFGDLGTDLPLIVMVLLVTGADTASVLILFGALQILTGFVYRMPLPVQPLKAMAALVITQELSAEILFGGGLAIGVIMLLLAATGALAFMGRLIPHGVVRGIQLGLGLQLGLLALRDYIPREGTVGFVLAALAFVAVVVLMKNRRVPAALVVVTAGALFAAVTRLDWSVVANGVGLRLPIVRIPQLEHIMAGLVLLALPQLPLSLANSVLATRQVAEDLFPGRAPTLTRLGLTYAGMNLTAPFLGGIPVCHGSGGMAGHYAFGGRTGGSVIIYGSLFFVIGLLFSSAFSEIIQLFPIAILGVLLLFESLTLVLLMRDVAGRGREALALTVVVGLACAGLPYGYVVGLVGGLVLHHATTRGWASLVDEH
jgi:hypothetical protein